MRGFLFSTILFILATIAHSGEGDLAPKILGGKETDAESHPWMVALISTGKGADPLQGQYAGGVLIGENWVLTAGHSVLGRNKDSIEVLVGAHQLREGEGRLIRSAEIILHPDYREDSAGNIHHDLALIRLAENADEAGTIGLATASQSSPGNLARAFGWGSLSGEEQIFSRKLHSVDLLIAENGLFDSTPYLNLEDHHVAALPTGKEGDTCEGDSGGPLVVYSGTTPKLAGIVSYGFACGTPGMPGIYADVSEHADWIRSVTGSTTGTTTSAVAKSFVEAHSTDLGGGWHFSEWLGYVNTSNYPWVFHDELGWVYVDDQGKGAKSADGVWLYDNRSGNWLWTAPGEDGWFASQAGDLFYFQFDGAPTEVYSILEGWFQR